MHIKMYADNTVLHCDIDKSIDIVAQIKTIIDKLCILNDLCKCNNFTINVEKTKCMLFLPSDGKFKSVWKNYPNIYLRGSQLKLIGNYTNT